MSTSLKDLDDFEPLDVKIVIAEHPYGRLMCTTSDGPWPEASLSPRKRLVRRFRPTHPTSSGMLGRATNAKPAEEHHDDDHDDHRSPRLD
ncbi:MULTISPECIES: hypothetical protein [unclassified Streptomyces]|uniref:hypothetical protein n=1 Tax=unclassified Streptomyces TaxID=2593676 RepID=UPI0033BD4F23